MYLNLDLLYNTYKYLYPLFYYGDNYGGREIYSPMTKKSITKSLNWTTCYDYITKKLNDDGRKSRFILTRIFTENTLNIDGFIFDKCDPFKLNFEDLYFLKSNTRINLI